jgi:hypothetical protein
MPLSAKTRLILEAISEGRSFEQILASHPAWTRHDIFEAASEALDMDSERAGRKSYDLEVIRGTHPDAYRKWDDAQDAELRRLFSTGMGNDGIAGIMKRQSGGIRSRLVKLGLAGPAAKPRPEPEARSGAVDPAKSDA